MSDKSLFLLSAACSFSGAFTLGLILDKLNFMYVVAMTLLFVSGYLNRLALEKRLYKKLRKDVTATIIRNRYFDNL